MGGRCPYVTGTVVACSGSSSSYMIDNGSARWVVHLDGLNTQGIYRVPGMCELKGQPAAVVYLLTDDGGHEMFPCRYMLNNKTSAWNPVSIGFLLLLLQVVHINFHFQRFGERHCNFPH